MGHVNVTSFWEGVLLMLKNMQAITDHISDSITVIRVVLALVQFIYGTFLDCSRGNIKKPVGKLIGFFDFSSIVDVVLYGGDVFNISL